jgi:hypothetical protein
MTEIVENEQLPSWLIELRDQQIQEQTEREAQPFVEEPAPPKQVDRPSLEADLRAQVAYAEQQMAQAAAESPPEEPEEPADMLGDLREQMILAAEEEEFEEEVRKRSSLTHGIMSLAPAQRLILAMLLFLNVVVCGCMGLVMLGRVSVP